mgnify:CR=1 FL=1
MSLILKIKQEDIYMKLLQQENVQIIESASDWQEAIRLSVLPLEKGGYVKECYKENIIQAIKKLGPYILIAENVALPHARPEQGTIKTQIAVTLFKTDIKFDQREVTARLFITLAAKDDNSHLNTLMKLSELLATEENIEKILKAEDVHTLYRYFETI